MMLPGLDGIPCTTKLRVERNVPIILLTARARTATKSWG